MSGENLNTDSVQEEKDQAGVAKELRRRYLVRFDHLKKGKEAYSQKNWPVAIKGYRDYLHVMIEYKGVGIRQLSPKCFDHKKELTEMLVISHVFWDLAKLYDRSIECRNEFEICLLLFVRFTTGFKYHNANLASFRRYIETKDVKNKMSFQRAYNSLLADSKKCFIASQCFGYTSPVTNFYRDFKPIIMGIPGGARFIHWYYKYSPRFISWTEQHPWVKKVFVNRIIKPLLLAPYKILKG
jgi:hypothetical protein